MSLIAAVSRAQYQLAAQFLRCRLARSAAGIGLDGLDNVLVTRQDVADAATTQSARKTAILRSGT
ncbi:hypothetical protein [Tropicibacter sp. Alg240-R139]|uniref:hypothetical protein n=1 Tax=Tropicibacter sp. Alg240-R139 TaxID=2305991 RepID=UPI0013DECE06|nr:hypothetical protein [Tropicibacter sp. Alg240-R139]